MFLCIIDNCKIDYERHIVMDSIKKEAQKDGFEDVIELGSIDGKKYYVVFNRKDEFIEDCYCYIEDKNGEIEKVFMGMLMIGYEKVCEDFEKNDPLGQKRKFISDNFDFLNCLQYK